MRRRRLGIATAVALGLSLAAAPSLGGESAADKLAAQKLLTQGNQLAGDGDYLGALDKFKAAYARFPSPKILLNIGTTLRQLGRNVEAIDVYESYLKDPKADPARHGDLERILKELNAVIGHIRIEVIDPGPDTTVRLDGKSVDDFKNGVSLRVEPGQHTVVADKKDSPSAVQTITVAAREEKLARLSFAALKPAPVVVVAPQSGAQRVVSFVLGGIGAAGIGVGAVFGGLAMAKNGQAKDHCYHGGAACDATGVSLGAAAKRNATISTVTFAIGGGALATGVVLFVTSGPGKKPAPEAAGKGVYVAAGPTIGGATFTAGGAW